LDFVRSGLQGRSFFFLHGNFLRGSFHRSFIRGFFDLN
jgi:hypothetical protein